MFFTLINDTNKNKKLHCMFFTLINSKNKNKNCHCMGVCVLFACFLLQLMVKIRTKTVIACVCVLFACSSLRDSGAVFL